MASTDEQVNMSKVILPRNMSGRSMASIHSAYGVTSQSENFVENVKCEQEKLDKLIEQRKRLISINQAFHLLITLDHFEFLAGGSLDQKCKKIREVFV